MFKKDGDVAQAGERYVRNVQVRGSTPLISTNCEATPIQGLPKTLVKKKDGSANVKHAFCCGYPQDQGNRYHR